MWPDNSAEVACVGERVSACIQVVDLLVEQMECADVIVLNKQDKCTDDQVCEHKETNSSRTLTTMTWNEH